MAPLTHPRATLIYNGRDVTADLSPYLMEVAWTDRLTGEADGLDVLLASPSGLDTRWLSDWYPDKAVTLSATLGYAGGPQAATGEMEVDEIEIDAPPLQVRVRAIAAGLTRRARTRIGRAYENKRLSQIVDEVAARLGAKRAGRINPDPLLDRVTQYQEGDWAFVSRLMREYGYTVKLTDNNRTLAVARPKTLSEQEPVATLTPGLVSAWRYRDKITDVPQRVTIRHHDPAKGGLTDADKTAGVEHAEDVRLIHRRARSSKDAAAQSEGEAERHTIDKTALSLTMPGDPAIVAGSVIALSGFARIDGRYLVTEARHSISRSGYALEIDTRRLA